MNNIQIFTNEAFGEIRTIEKNGEPWFVGKDVAEILGYAKPLNALATHVDGDDSLKQGLIDNLGRTQQTIFINESGLYSLIFYSKLPQAKEFRRWVTHEVLPTIRKHGVYATEEVLNNPDTWIEVLQAYKDEKQRNKELNAQVIELQPKANYCDTILNAKGTISTTEIAKMYGKGAAWLNKLLHAEKVQYKVNGRWVLYCDYAGKGYTSVKSTPYTNSSGEIKSADTMYWTPKGKEFIYNKLKNLGILPINERELLEQ